MFDGEKIGRICVLLETHWEAADRVCVYTIASPTCAIGCNISTLEVPQSCFVRLRMLFSKGPSIPILFHGWWRHCMWQYKESDKGYKSVGLK